MLGNSPSKVTTTSPASSGSARAATLMPVVVFGISAISSSAALINRAASHRASVSTALMRSTGHIAGRPRSRLQAASTAWLRAGTGPVLAALR